MAHFSSPLNQTFLWLFRALILSLIPMVIAFAPGRSMVRRQLLRIVPQKRSAGMASVANWVSLLHPEPSFRQHRMQISGRLFRQSFSTRLEPLDSTLLDEDPADTAMTSTSQLAGGIQIGGSNGTATASEDDLLDGLSSRPVEGGNWNPRAPVAWATNFGRRSAEYEASLQSLIHLQPGDEGYFDTSDLKIPKVAIVRTKEDAKVVMEKLMNADRTILHACDTEVMDINLKEVGPIGNGYVTCASVYSGPDFDYGLGDGPGSTLWIDNLDDACGILQEFKEWFEDPTCFKVWHNYGFDRHVMWNEGIDCQGFGGDTMHMARLQDSSRGKSGEVLGYSLEALTSTILDIRKRPMKEIFGVPRMRMDGTPGSIIDVPPIEILQRDPRFRKNFILYSCYDAEGTWKLHEKLVKLLKNMNWLSNGKNLYDYYWENMREFGKVLTDMERRGIRVDAKDYLASVERQARIDRDVHSKKFREWAASKIGPDGLALNPASSLQLGIFLFGGAVNIKTKERTDSRRVLKVKREEVPEVAIAAYKKRDDDQATSSVDDDPQTDQLDQMTAVQLKALCKEQGLKVSGKKTELQDRLREHFLTSSQAEPQKYQLSVDKLQIDELDKMTAAQLKALCKEHGLKVSGKKAGLQDRLREHFLSSSQAEAEKDEFALMSDEELRLSLAARDLETSGDRSALLARLREDIMYIRDLETAIPPDAANGYRTISEALEAAAKNGGTVGEILAAVNEKISAEPKTIDVTITSLGMQPEKYTMGGAPSVTADVLRGLAGDPFQDPPRYGSQAYDFFGGGKEGHDACVALYSLCAIGSIDTMIANFLTSLQTLADHDSRVHCSLNLNTETGRLSSRRPNLQNQPALEKDTYKIRQAFQSSPGNSLIVADYGQLELRLLASMTRCKSMIEAFESGGDFHSRTALDMFDYVQKKVEDGDVLLEWDYTKGDPPKPLLKDEFASERRKAKTLNFSIAYGKTAHGLSEDWGVTQTEAQEMLDKWYDARPEVRDWQKNTKAYARKYGITRTLMGRYRQLPEAMSKNRRFVGQAERASINTPIQGGAADVAMMAMNKINNSKILERLGWILLMQIHDEVILEGPEETAEEAFKEVIQCMESPWVPGLEKTAVPLLVDGSYKHKNWYEAK
eukprot:scaffold4637_cov128-Cylindrotheca_fusiformis.AAC.24